MSHEDDVIDDSIAVEENLVTYLVLANNLKCDLTIHNVNKVFAFYGLQLNSSDYYCCNRLLNCNDIRFVDSCIKYKVWRIYNNELYKYNARLKDDDGGKYIVEAMDV